ncbi:glycoside hydrolase family 3 protein [Pseudocercospora fijiensis CIRAD86]|uniref:beta-glucosidase n=1 Tax=Pseudocercospora fijiensis (strain CIRAD86) TaxID=383855 RepID=M3B1M3_PSEFD|nr:glycoside hydrolase family 3 protein [Pseudocercospora fijiensis CIRAD86]EME83243.1 glycoside hydrolase family 3 protein [Pseudocercospora fijiensis CIRAD86]
MLWLQKLGLLIASTTALANPQPDHDGEYSPLARAPYKDPSLPVGDRVKDLVSRMTIQEKTAQLMQGDISNWFNTTTGAFNQSGLEANFEQKAGMVWAGYTIPWDWLASNIKRGIDYAVNSTRLGIPPIVQTEGIHGFRVGNATIFNSPIGYACSWNRMQVQAMAVQIAREAQALGISQVFAPLADLAREPRYGRVEETFGEDGYLAGEIAYAYVKGVQSLNVSAMVKHFTASSEPEQGLNTGPVHGGERELRTTWLPSYKKAIVDAGAWAIMSAYASYDGVPQVADEHTLTEILRDEWGYKFWVSSDAGATDRLAKPFRICPSPLTKYGSPITEGNECVTLNALPAGGDVEMGGGSFSYRSIPDLVASGRLDVAVVDTAVSRVLRAKFEMGLFERPYQIAPESEWSSIIRGPDAQQLAREVDRDSIVLLKNDHQILPISKDKKVAVIGPMAHGFMNYGDYVVDGSQYRGVTPLDGIQAALGNDRVSYAQGCARWSLNQSGFPAAVEAASKADVAIVVVGTWSRDQVELWQGLNATTGEHVDLSSLNLVGAQSDLLRAVINTKTPTVVVFSSGKPITEDWISNTTASLVQQFYPSEQGGNALADILFGAVSPSGKLSVSFPHDVGTLPIYYDHLNSARQIGDSGFVGADGQLYFGHQYVLNTPNPWFPFGYGLSYTNFSYSNVTLDKSNVSSTDTITASVSVTNQGTRDGAEVIQLYVKDMIASVDVPNIQLKGFEKVMFHAGETKDVKISLNVSDVGLWNRKMQYVVEPGEFVVYMGSSSADLAHNASFWVEGMSY